MFYESDLKRIATEIATLQKNYDIYAKFVLGEKGEGYVCLGISKQYNDKYFVPNPKLIPQILCEQAFYPNYLYPYQTFFQINEESYLKCFMDIAQMARKLEGIKHAYAWYDHTVVPDRIRMVDANDILDVYEKYINDWFPEEKIRFQALLVTFIKKTQAINSESSKWKQFQQTIQYDTTKSKFKNHIRFLSQEDLSNVSSEYIHTNFDQVEHIYLKESEYQMIKRWFSGKHIKLIYSAEKVFHDYKQDLFKKFKNNPWEFHETNEDIWRISIPKIMKEMFHEIYLDVCYQDATCEEWMKMFATSPIYVFQLPKTQWEYWKDCAKFNRIPYSIDQKHHFSSANFDNIPIIVCEQDYMKIDAILNKIVDVYMKSHIEIPKSERLCVDGFVFKSGQQLSKEESEIMQRHFRKVEDSK